MKQKIYTLTVVLARNGKAETRSFKLTSDLSLKPLSNMLLTDLELGLNL